MTYGWGIRLWELLIKCWSDVSGHLHALAALFPVGISPPFLFHFQRGCLGPRACLDANELLRTQSSGLLSAWCRDLSASFRSRCNVSMCRSCSKLHCFGCVNNDLRSPHRTSLSNRQHFRCLFWRPRFQILARRIAILNKFFVVFFDLSKQMLVKMPQIRPLPLPSTFFATRYSIQFNSIQFNSIHFNSIQFPCLSLSGSARRRQRQSVAERLIVLPQHFTWRLLHQWRDTTWTVAVVPYC
jgi:hypothetical protein